MQKINKLGGIERWIFIKLFLVALIRLSGNNGNYFDRKSIIYINLNKINKACDFAWKLKLIILEAWFRLRLIPKLKLFYYCGFFGIIAFFYKIIELFRFRAIN
ncbi:unnamed protein product [Blepharisma stoltei]|uniref:Uncharacterized protein n=1 Tax=Blepharisma stoltei TaxID=1481888 RepID=A0AAU9JZ39_9CILI|nr:unnamed protein product [Blepharisma stoltei]